MPIYAEPVSEHQRSDQRRKKTIGYHSCGRKTVYLSSFLGNAYLQTLSNHTQTPTCIAHNATCPTNTYKKGKPRVHILWHTAMVDGFIACCAW